MLVGVFIIDTWLVFDGVSNEIIQPAQIDFDKGDLVIFRCDVVYAGSEYNRSCVRVHVYANCVDILSKTTSRKLPDKGGSFVPVSIKFSIDVYGSFACELNSTIVR